MIAFGSTGPQKPKWPLGYIRRETDGGPFCPECRSSQVWPWGFLGWLFRRSPLGCIQPECSEYYEHQKVHKVPKSSIADEVARAESSQLPGEVTNEAPR